MAPRPIPFPPPVGPPPNLDALSARIRAGIATFAEAGVSDRPGA